MSISIGGGAPPHGSTGAALQAGLTSALRTGTRVRTAGDPDGDGDNDHGRVEHSASPGPAGAAGRGLLVDTTA